MDSTDSFLKKTQKDNLIAIESIHCHHLLLKLKNFAPISLYRKETVQKENCQTRT